MNKKYLERKERILPDGKPRYMRFYDSGEGFIGRYTAVFTGRYLHKTGGTPIDRPAYAHLGKKISFDDLPEDCKTFVLQEYVYMWDITDHSLYREN